MGRGYLKPGILGFKGTLEVRTLKRVCKTNACACGAELPNTKGDRRVVVTTQGLHSTSVSMCDKCAEKFIAGLVEKLNRVVPYLRFQIPSVRP